MMEYTSLFLHQLGKVRIFHLLGLQVLFHHTFHPSNYLYRMKTRPYQIPPWHQKLAVLNLMSIERRTIVVNKFSIGTTFLISSIIAQFYILYGAFLFLSKSDQLHFLKTCYRIQDASCLTSSFFKSIEITW